MIRILRRTYFSLLLPAVFLIASLYGLSTWDVIPVPVAKEKAWPILSPCIFVLSAMTAVAFPIFYRSLFAHRVRDEKSVPEAAWIPFERNQILIALATPYFVLIAYLLGFPRFYFAGTILMALYAGYYFYPSQRRIGFERRLFRVE